MTDRPAENTDVPLFVATDGAKVHRTAGHEGLGINVGGNVVVQSPSKWHALAWNAIMTTKPSAESVKRLVQDLREAEFDSGMHRSELHTHYALEAAARLFTAIDALANAEPAAAGLTREQINEVIAGQHFWQHLSDQTGFALGGELHEFARSIAALVGSPAPSSEPVAEIYRGGMGRGFGKATVLCRWMPGAADLPDGTHLLYFGGTGVAAPPSPAAQQAPLEVRIPATLAAAMVAWSGAEPSQSLLAREIEEWMHGVDQQAAPAAPEVRDAMDMSLCEATSVVLREGQLYRFWRVGDCKTCISMAAQSKDAYGPPPLRPSQMREADAALAPPIAAPEQGER